MLLKNPISALSQNLQGRGSDEQKKIWGDAEVDWEAAGVGGSPTEAALNTDVRSRRDLAEFLRSLVLRVFQQHL